MKLLAISSSPRAHSNSQILLDELLGSIAQNRSATEEPIVTESLSLRGLTIAPCTQCDYCQQTVGCSIQDDMQPIYSKLAQADWLVLASPIYFMAHCAQAKALIDRCQVFWARKHRLKQPLPRTLPAPPRRAVFLAVGATHGPNVFAGAKVTMRWFLDAIEMEYWDNLLIEGVDAPGAIADHPTALEQARQLGQKIAAAS